MGLHPYMVESPNRMIGLIWAVPVKYGPELVVLSRLRLQDHKSPRRDHPSQHHLNRCRHRPWNRR